MWFNHRRNRSSFAGSRRRFRLSGLRILRLQVGKITLCYWIRGSCGILTLSHYRIFSLYCRLGRCNIRRFLRRSSRLRGYIICRWGYARSRLGGTGSSRFNSFRGLRRFSIEAIIANLLLLRFTNMRNNLAII